MSGRFVHSYAELGDSYSAAQTATPVSQPVWMAFNHELAATLDWPTEWRQTDVALSALAGNTTLPDSRPVATVYAGHQFGSYNPRLGDGRALLLGEWQAANGERVDIQLKGAGPTPWSRGGDGRSPTGPVVREYLVSEAMHALGVPTTRALAAVATGDPVFRERPEPGAILTRVARSHLRIGTIQYFAMTQGGEGLGPLVDYIAERHYAEALAASPKTAPAVVLLQEYSERLAELVSHWQSLGFVHGVMNTDNMLLCGDTVDYGPCAFMDHFDAQAVFSSIDHGGRYAWPNQPPIAHWNLSVLAQCLLPLLDANEETALQLAQAEVDAFPARYMTSYNQRMAARFGLDRIRSGDDALIDAWFQILAEEQLDLTLAFRWLTEEAEQTQDHSPLPELFTAPPRLQDWRQDWRDRRDRNEGDEHAVIHAMQTANPCVIPRNHLVASAIAAAEGADFVEFQRLNDRWRKPYQWQSGDELLARGPEEEERVLRTFCGT